MEYLLFLLLGLCFGSFGNVLITRVPSRESIGGRSMCPHCKNVLSALELIPVLSYLFLGGRCKKCRKPISVMYPLTEELSALVFLGAALVQDDFWAAIFLALALWLLLIISIIDQRTRMISDGLNIPFVITAGMYNVLAGEFTLTGMLLTGGFFGALWLAGRGKWIGSGDVILGAGIGFIAGQWKMALAALAITYMVGALIVSVLLVSRRISRTDYVAFAPFLCFGAYIIVFLQVKVDMVLKLYFGI